jgi:Cu/Ag efflux protein CusF
MIRFLALLLGFALAGGAAAQMKDHDMKGMGGMSMQQPADAPADGEVRKVDKSAKKITLRHGPIPSLEMPAMTMVYRVEDPAMLDQVKAGDKVKFSAEKLGEALTITKIEPVK